MGYVAKVIDYTFTPATKKIVFKDVAIVDVSAIQYIYNVSRGISLYNYSSPTAISTDGTNIVTISASTAGMLATDQLDITYFFLTSEEQELGQQIMANSAPVVIASDQSPLDVNITSVLAPLIPVFSTRSDVFTTTTNGTIVNVSASPVKYFALQVNQTGTITSWTVVLEVSLDGTNFTTILTHTNILGDGMTVYIGTLTASSLYFRSRCSAITLGAGTNVTAIILGTV